MGDKGSEKPVDAKVIKKTQDVLGRIIKKPPLTDKLLQKPPFRFLHDIVTSVIKSTGFMKGLFTDVEMNSDNVKDKDSKVAFLQKLIDMVSLVNGKPIAAKPSKIVAGHDADRTNELLQALAEAVNKKVDNDDYVRRVLKVDDSKPSSKKESSGKEASSSKSKEKDESSTRSKERRDNTESGDKEKSRSEGRSRDHAKEKSKDTEEDTRKEQSSRHRRADESNREHRRRDEDDSVTNDEDRSRRHRDESRGKGDESRGHREESRGHGSESRSRHDKDDDKQDADGSEQKLQRPSSAKGSRRHQSRGAEETKKDNRMNTGASQEEDSAQSAPKSRPARPSSARPAPPKPKKNDVITEDPVVAGRKVPNVIVDKKGNSDDDDDDEKQDFLGKDDDADETAVHAASKSKHSNEVDADGDGDHGGLVKKILETKKELEAQPTPGKKTQIDRSQVLSDATRRKERDVAQHEIDRLRSSVQTLTRSVNPLGKILDFLQEDLDAMQKEMAVWHQENKDNMVALHREQSVTESLVEPLKAQLAELDSAIRDQLDLIAAVKSTILHNDLKISKMLGAVTKS